ncbi:MAG: tetratricopeptide repeat protein, partial [Thermoguttaceae bacterium]
AQTLQDIKPYQNTIIAGLVVAVLAVAGYSIMSHLSRGKTEQAWNAVNVGVETGNPSVLNEVIENYPNTNVAEMAAVISGDYRLIEGCSRLLTEKAVALQHLSQAVDSYSKALEGGSPMVRERATFGLGRAWEARGDLEAARRHYKEVVTTWPDGAFVAAAQQRLDDLNRPAMKRFFDAVATYTPAKVAPRESATPGELPSFMSDGLPPAPPAGKELNLERLGQEPLQKAEPGKGKTEPTTVKPEPKRKQTDAPKAKAPEKAKNTEKK